MTKGVSWRNKASGSAKEAAEEMEADDTEMADDNAETDEAANKANRTGTSKPLTMQQKVNAETSSGQPDLSPLNLRDPAIYRCFNKALERRQDSASSVDLAQDVLKQLNNEMKQALLN